ncbi:MAG TPA: hypothetical protein VFB24_19560 [Candidatus Binatia bacterium]|jgi:hypothetical protein|nr:hypothetical protein [Candidatus Binatia bacterium]
MKKEMIVEIELGRIEDGLPGIHGLGIQSDAPELVAEGCIAEFAGGLSRITIDVKPGI